MPLIGWDRARRQRNLPLVVNNVRFLILPWVQVERLASKVLATNIRRLAADWQAFYACFIHLITRNLDYEDDRWKFARYLLKELEWWLRKIKAIYNIRRNFKL